MPRTMKRPVGAPSKIDEIVVYTPDGIPVTAQDRLCEVLRTGDFVHAACEAAHIDQSTYYGWLAKGADAARKIAAGERVTANERRYAEFVTLARDAETEGRQRIVGAIASHATTGAVVVTKTKKLDARGKVIERTIREEHRPSDPSSAQWMAERRWPKDWNRRQQLEVSGPEGGPIKIESPLADLMSKLDAMDRREQAIDVAAREVDEDGGETDAGMG
jgi:hypothetical protein